MTTRRRRLLTVLLLIILPLGSRTQSVLRKPTTGNLRDVIGSGHGAGNGGKHDWSRLDEVLTSLEQALQFLTSETDKVNLDTIIGTRIVEGQLTVLLERMARNDSDVMAVPSVARQRIDNVRFAAGHVSDLATPYIREFEPDYFNEIGVIIGRDFWRENFPSRDINKSTAMTSSMTSCKSMVETQSDKCLAELFGTTRNAKVTCLVSRDCWRRMTSEGCRSYTLTHQVFYFEIGQSFGCFTDEMKRTTDEYNGKFCTRVYDETTDIATQRFPLSRHDLFMEQAALCGILGYREFFRSDWLNAILSWQRLPRGCWPINHDLHDILPHHGTEQTRQRTKRRERVLEDGCSCHRTAVAIASLAQYIRYVVEGQGHLPSSADLV